MISENENNGICVGIQADRAYFLHSNRGNPCTDIMLSFGDTEPGALSHSEGKIWIREGRAAENFIENNATTNYTNLH